MALPIQEIVPAQFVPNSVGVLYTSPASTATRIDKLTLSNLSGAVANVTIYIVPSGGTPGNSNVTTPGQAIQTGGVFNSPNEYGHYLNPGDGIYAVASAANALAILVAGTIVVG
jgi:hypothetical protein